MLEDLIDPLGRRSHKPRSTGLTMMIDPGLPADAFDDVISSFAPHVDFVKFGWGTALVTPRIDRKIATLTAAGIPFFFGGSLFERFLLADRLEEFLDFVRGHGARHVEVSNGTIALSQHDKAEYVHLLAQEFTVFAEVGFKEADRAERMRPDQWVSAIAEDHAAGASLVITEARESGRSGIADRSGKLRDDVFDAILDATPAESLMFEAPSKELQVELIRALGPDVNLGNIAAHDLVGVETLRLGLRGDTLLDLAPRGRRGLSAACTFVSGRSRAGSPAENERKEFTNAIGA